MRSFTNVSGDVHAYPCGEWTAWADPGQTVDVDDTTEAGLEQAEQMADLDGWDEVEPPVPQPGEVQHHLSMLAVPVSLGPAKRRGSRAGKG